MNKLINTILMAVTGIVAVIFVVGHFKKNADVQRIDQSSVKQLNTDDLTNKYIKELQGKLKQEEKESLEALRKAQQYKPVDKPKDEDWSKVPVEQQISRDQAPVEVQKTERSTAGATVGGTVITKENAAEFIATARKNGYHVVLSPTYEVLSMTPILNTRNIDESFETHSAE